MKNIHNLSDTSKLLNTTIKALEEKYEYKNIKPVYDELVQAGITNIVIVVGLSIEDKKHYLDHFYIMYKNDSDKQYFISKGHNYGYSINSYIHYKYLSTYKRNDIIKEHGLSDLKKVNKPTVKKIKELFENELKKDSLFESADNEIIQKVDSFLETIKTFIKNRGHELETYSQSNDLKRGWFDTKEFQYRYEIHSDGWIEEKMSYTGETNLEAFKSKV